mmetsp:Transcript_9443/g.33416  ORF Transcript_9443/g.33416 Transcript_9443/m.33416 type:complete len:214 (-) Transcript_9443:1521-2162(-)
MLLHPREVHRGVDNPCLLAKAKGRAAAATAAVDAEISMWLGWNLEVSPDALPAVKVQARPHARHQHVREEDGPIPHPARVADGVPGVGDPAERAAHSGHADVGVLARAAETVQKDPARTLEATALLELVFALHAVAQELLVKPLFSHLVLSEVIQVVLEVSFDAHFVLLFLSPLRRARRARRADVLAFGRSGRGATTSGRGIFAPGRDALAAG